MTGVLSRHSSPSLDDRFGVRVRVEPSSHLIEMTGDLDLVSRRAALDACTAPDYVHVIADLAHITFMDCCGYGALVRARTILQRRGGSLSMAGPVGQPLRLLSLIDQRCDR